MAIVAPTLVADLVGPAVVVCAGAPHASVYYDLAYQRTEKRNTFIRGYLHPLMIEPPPRAFPAVAVLLRQDLVGLVVLAAEEVEGLEVEDLVVLADVWAGLDDQNAG